MYRIELTPEALADLESIRQFEQRRIVAEMESQLLHEPTNETRNRKRLRPNLLAEWELRVGTFRIFYDVVAGEELVKVAAVGWKAGNELFIHGEKFVL